MREPTQPFVEVATQATVANLGRSFEDFFEAEYNTLFRRMWLVCGDRNEAEEIVQDSFLRIWERWDRLRDIEDPTGYLYRTAMNVFRSRYRRGLLAVRRVVGQGRSADD